MNVTYSTVLVSAVGEDKLWVLQRWDQKGGNRLSKNKLAPTDVERQTNNQCEISVSSRTEAFTVLYSELKLSVKIG